MKPAQHMALASIVTTDLAAITRGRPVPADRLDKYAEAGAGWVPANLCLTPFNSIADPNPWGSTGDLRIVPDMEARYMTDLTGASTSFDMVMANIVDLDGAPWEGCPRTRLIDALDALLAETGLTVIAAFEQELKLAGEGPPAHAFSFEALRRADPFVPTLYSALEDAGIHPEMVLAEYGAHQFEITHAPAPALTAADRAVAIREITREVARHAGTRASFTPKPDPDSVGNGVHIHFSLIGADGAPAGFDPAGPGRLSRIGGMFAAGVLRHLPAMTALTAASVPSYLRLKPHSWSASYTSLAERDREASLRICPTVSIGGRDPARQFNLEYRAADATANPYLALAAIVRAGLEGIRADLPTPPITTGDPSLMSPAELSAGGLVRLPQSLADALEVFVADRTVTGWFTPAFVESYIGVKRAEIVHLDGMSPKEVCALYGTLF